MNFFELLKFTAPVFILLGVGALCRRLQWMEPNADRTLLKLGVNVLLPCLIADTVLGNSLLAKASDLAFPPLLGFGLIVGSMGMVALMLAPLRLPHETSSAGIITAGIQNFGYLVIPLVESLYDKETLGVLFMHNLGVDIAMWSVGCWVLVKAKRGDSWKHLLSAPGLAVIGSGALNLLHFNAWLPAFFRKSLHMLGQTAIPLAILLTGATMFDQMRQTTQEPFKYKPLTLALVARMAVLPMLVLAIARWFPMPAALRNILVIQAAMPSAMMPVVLCRMHGADSKFSVQIILASTALGFFTIPLWIRFGSTFVAG